MANILDRYGIKEVADVTFYKIESNGEAGAPVLFLDTLKVSTIEQTAEQAEARGGKGNPPLIIWDYGKEITVTLEDALFSAKSMAIMFGDGNVDEGSEADVKITKTWKGAWSTPQTTGKLEYGNKEIHISQLTPSYYDAKGNALVINGEDAAAKFYLESDTKFENAIEAAFMTAEIPTKELGLIEISANTFPGTYYVAGDTFARSEVTGEDEFFQFIIPKAKMNAENTITLEAEGDPSVFNMTLRVLRPADGKMMKLVKYNLADDLDKEKSKG